MKYIYLQLIVSHYFMSEYSMYTEGGNVITESMHIGKVNIRKTHLFSKILDKTK